MRLMNEGEVAAAVERARQAQTAWSELSFRARARFVLRAREIVLAEVDEIASLVSRETGKPPAEATSMEIVPTLDLMHYFARNTVSRASWPIETATSVHATSASSTASGRAGPALTIER